MEGKNDCKMFLLPHNTESTCMHRPTSWNSKCTRRLAFLYVT